MPMTDSQNFNNFCSFKKRPSHLGQQFFLYFHSCYNTYKLFLIGEMEVHAPDNNELKCPTCSQAFANLEFHKEHYKSDFHRYNIKRKMVKLAPITEEQFRAKKIESKALESEGFKCNECGKKFNSAQTLNQHAQSKKHNPQLEKMQPETAQAPKQPKPFVKDPNVCLFCKNESTALQNNLRHMEASHGFFVPQLEFCTDTEGLIKYLQEKIEVGFMCITCENKGAKDFATGEAVRKHMVDKCHTFMKTQDGYEEYEKFYDFSRQFEELLELQKNLVVPGISYTDVKVYVKDSDKAPVDGQEEEWEDEDEDEDGAEEDEWESEEGDSENEGGEEKDGKEKKKKIRTYKIMKPTLTSNDELLLPNGKTLGHRKYRFLYRQTYRNPFWLKSSLKAIGWNAEAVNNAVIAREKMVQIAKHDKLLYNSNLRRDKGALKNGMQNNMIMKFFRCQNSL